MVTSTVSFNRHNSRKKFHIQHALGPSEKLLESTNHSNINEQQHSHGALGQVDDVLPRQTTISRDCAGVIEVNWKQSLVIPTSPVGIADGKLEIRYH